MKILGQNKYFCSSPVAFLFPNLPSKSLLLTQMLSPVSVMSMLGQRGHTYFQVRLCCLEDVGTTTLLVFITSLEPREPSPRLALSSIPPRDPALVVLLTSTMISAFSLPLQRKRIWILNPTEKLKNHRSLETQIQLNPTAWAGKQIFYTLGEVWQVGKYFLAEHSPSGLD